MTIYSKCSIFQRAWLKPSTRHQSDLLNDWYAIWWFNTITTITWLVVGTSVLFFHILGISSSQLTDKNIFQRGRYTLHQTQNTCGSLGKRSLGKNPYMCQKRNCLFSTICLLFVSYLPLFFLITILLIFSYFSLFEGQCLPRSSLGVNSRKMLSTRDWCEKEVVNKIIQ